MNFEALAQWSEIVGGFAFILVALWLFRQYVLPAVRKGEIARNADLEAAERRRVELRAEVEAARRQADASARDASEIRTRGAADAQREHDRIVAEAQREAARIVANAQGELERGRQAARDRLRIELIEKALLRARELAAQRVTPSVDERLVNKTVDDVSARKGP